MGEDAKRLRALAPRARPRAQHAGTPSHLENFNINPKVQNGYSIATTSARLERPYEEASTSQWLFGSGADKHKMKRNTERENPCGYHSRATRYMTPCGRRCELRNDEGSQIAWEIESDDGTALNRQQISEAIRLQRRELTANPPKKY